MPLRRWPCSAMIVADRCCLGSASVPASISARPTMIARGLFISWAAPAAISATAFMARVWARASWASTSRRLAAANCSASCRWASRTWAVRTASAQAWDRAVSSDSCGSSRATSPAAAPQTTPPTHPPVSADRGTQNRPASASRGPTAATSGSSSVPASAGGRADRRGRQVQRQHVLHGPGGVDQHDLGGRRARRQREGGHGGRAQQAGGGVGDGPEHVGGRGVGPQLGLERLAGVEVLGPGRQPAVLGRQLAADVAQLAVGPGQGRAVQLVAGRLVQPQGGRPRLHVADQGGDDGVGVGGGQPDGRQQRAAVAQDVVAAVPQVLLADEQVGQRDQVHQPAVPHGLGQGGGGLAVQPGDVGDRLRQPPPLAQPLAGRQVVDADDGPLDVGDVAAEQVDALDDPGEALGQRRVQGGLAQVVQQAAQERRWPGRRP